MGVCSYMWARDFSSPFLGPNFGPIPNAKMTNIFQKKMVENSQSGTPKKFVIVHLKQRIYQLFYEEYNKDWFKAVKPQQLTA